MPGDHNKKYSSIQEKRIAKNIDGQTQIASGALPLASKKGDVRNYSSENWKILIDGKTTKAKTYQSGVRSKEIKKDWLNKIKQEAREGGYDIAALAFSFDNIKDFYILEDVDFNNMYQALLDYERLTAKYQQQIQELKQRIEELEKYSQRTLFELQEQGAFNEQGIKISFPLGVQVISARPTIEANSVIVHLKRNTQEEGEE